jgi:hypothetical protein
MYSFTLKDSYTNKIINVNPYYSDAEITTELQNNRYVKTLNGNWQFIGVDFTNIMSKPITTTFYMTMYKDGVPYPDGNAKFTFNEIEVDYDKKILNVKMLTNTLQDTFNNILANEYDLKQIPINKTSINYTEKIQYQLYALGGSEVLNLQYNNYSFQNCAIEDKWIDGKTNYDGYFGKSGISVPKEPSLDAIGETLKHVNQAQFSYINAPTLPVHGAWYCKDTKYSGAWEGRFNSTLSLNRGDYPSVWVHESGLYYLCKWSVFVGSGQGLSYFDHHFMIRNSNDNSLYVEKVVQQDDEMTMFNEDVIFTKIGVDF